MSLFESNFSPHLGDPIMVNSIVDLLNELVRIDSVNLTLSHGPGEIEIAKFIRDRLDELELSPEIQTSAPDRYNVVAVVPGANPGKSLLFNSHLDTVGVEGKDLFSGLTADLFFDILP